MLHIEPVNGQSLSHRHDNTDHALRDRSRVIVSVCDGKPCKQLAV